MRAKAIMAEDFFIKIQPMPKCETSFGFKNRVFRRNHVGNDPVNRVDSSGLYAPDGWDLLEAWGYASSAYMHIGQAAINERLGNSLYWKISAIENFLNVGPYASENVYDFFHENAVTHKTLSKKDICDGKKVLDGTID